MPTILNKVLCYNYSYIIHQKTGKKRWNVRPTQASQMVYGKVSIKPTYVKMWRLLNGIILRAALVRQIPSVMAMFLESVSSAVERKK